MSKSYISRQLSLLKNTSFFHLALLSGKGLKTSLNEKGCKTENGTVVSLKVYPFTLTPSLFIYNFVFSL